MTWKERIPWKVVENACAVYSLNPLLVGAIIGQESGGNRFAVRYEPAFRYRHEVVKFAKINGISAETESMLQATSVGLMQVMGCVARELGYEGNLLALTESAVGIGVGCQKLSQLGKKYDNLEDVIASYNSGSPLTDSKGVYRNVNYVRSVLNRMAELEKWKK